jgi:HAD superfamily hydrolase (TIGR01509 family)
MEGVVFDMDGVLVDSEQYWQDYLSNNIIPDTIEADEFSIEAIEGKNQHDIWDYLAENHDLCLTHEEFISRYSLMAEDVYNERVSFIEGGERFLNELNDRGLHLAIASSSPMDWIKIVVERFDLDGLFDILVSAEDIDGPGKPDGYIYNHTVSELGCEPESCIAVEDTEHGMQAAMASGLYCIGFSRSYAIDAENSPTDAVAETPNDLYEMITALC